MKTKYKDFTPYDDRCNNCPLFAFAGERSYCKYDFQTIRKKCEGTAGGIYVPTEECRVKKIRVYEK